MAITFPSLNALLDHGFDTLIDVRSPAEYAEDHIPGAINLPALSNAERIEVGTIYTQISPFAARKIGAAMVARNVAAHLEGPLAGHHGGWRPLVHCWRGGQRSGSFAGILQQIGWRADTIAGGYKTYRALVRAALYDDPLTHRLILLDGYTGTAKTALLPRLAALGAQVIDLEGMAEHRGSLLGGSAGGGAGGSAGGQPSQKAFESRLAAALAGCDPARPVIAEAESSKIGRITLPPSLWTALCAAPRVEITAPLPARAAYLAAAYADIAADPTRLVAQLDQLRVFRGHAAVDGWIALLAAQDLTGLATALMRDHYDPAYAKSRSQHSHGVIAALATDRLDPAALDSLARAILAALSSTA